MVTLPLASMASEETGVIKDGMYYICSNANTDLYITWSRSLNTDKEQAGIFYVKYNSENSTYTITYSDGGNIKYIKPTYASWSTTSANVIIEATTGGDGYYIKETQTAEQVLYEWISNEEKITPQMAFSLQKVSDDELELLLENIQ